MRWGIIGTGKIARRFASDLKLVSGAVLSGVTCRNSENNKKFAEEFGARAFETIEDLLASPVEIVYVATPHASHKTHSMMALLAGKSVLCEKPFAMNFSESLEIIDLAKSKNIFLMEAMWTRFFPAIKDALEVVETGQIGKLIRIESSFGYSAPFDPASRIFNPTLGGGSLLDVGVYSIALARMFIPGMPAEILASAVESSTGVDESASWTLKFPTGVTASGESSVVKVLKNEALIIGSKGKIRIPQFWHPSEYYLNEKLRSFSYEGLGFQFEANEVMTCIRQGLYESPLLPLRHTTDVMRIMDGVRDKLKNPRSQL